MTELGVVIAREQALCLGKEKKNVGRGKVPRSNKRPVHRLES